METSEDKLSILNQQLESFIQKECTSSKAISKFIFKELKESILKLFDNKLSNFIGALKQTKQEKYVLFIRHAESKYNAWRKKSPLFNFSQFYKNIEENRNPSITQTGVDQCKQLKQKLLDR